MLLFMFGLSLWITFRRPYVRAWRCSCTGVLQAEVVLEGIRARSRKVLDICADRGTERRRDLCRRVPSDDVAADDIAADTSASTKVDAVDVSADPIILNEVVLACT